MFVFFFLFYNHTASNPQATRPGLKVVNMSWHFRSTQQWPKKVWRSFLKPNTSFFVYVTHSKLRLISMLRTQEPRLFQVSRVSNISYFTNCEPSLIYIAQSFISTSRRPFLERLYRLQRQIVDLSATSISSQLHCFLVDLWIQRWRSSLETETLAWLVIIWRKPYMPSLIFQRYIPKTTFSYVIFKVCIFSIHVVG